MNKLNILITGSNSQLGKSIKSIYKNFDKYRFYFKNKKRIDITKNDIEFFLIEKKINIIINCAAYTNVNEAEHNQKNCDLINHISVSNIAKLSKKLNILLIHISTDYIFDGKKRRPYLERDLPKPINFYGYSKLMGENSIKKINYNYLILRTSFLYSEYNKNFLKSILSNIKNNKILKVVDDQISCPTYAKDLAYAILKIIESTNSLKISYVKDTLNISNIGNISRYGFVKAVCETLNIEKQIIPINTKQINVKRPKYSALDNTKIFKKYKIKMPAWKLSLNKCLKNIYIK